VILNGHEWSGRNHRGAGLPKETNVLHDIQMEKVISIADTLNMRGN